ncbi:Ig-like domain-containing protein [Neobacillus mesonae]|nr:Ig-like domain-containing protein [Neobacillus mesonae]
MISFLRTFGFLSLVMVLALIHVPPSPAKASARITIDSHQNGQTLPPGIAQLYGTYTDVYEVELIVNGEMITDVLMDDQDGDDSGEWSYPLDTSRWDGPIEIVLKSKDTGTRYGIWSSFMSLVIDNPEAHIPEIEITSPSEQTPLKAKEKVSLSVSSKNTVTGVELRIDGKDWIPLKSAKDGYTYQWDTRAEQRKVHSLEARATDNYGNTGYSPTLYVNIRGKSSVTDDVYDTEYESEEDISLSAVDPDLVTDSIDDSDNPDHTVTDHVYDPDAGVVDSVYDPESMEMDADSLNVPSPLPDQDRAIWIWETASYHLVLNPNSWSVLSSLASDTATFNQRPITTLYLGVDQYNGTSMLEDHRSEVRQFITWAHGEGFRVEALIAGGTKPPYFGAYERYRTQAVREFEKVLNYNIASETEAQFDGINLDTEPYILPDFKTAKPSVQVQYLDMLAALMERKAASGLSLPVGAAIPRWYDTSADASDIPWNGAVKWMSEHIQDTADYISIMNYRDQAEGSAGIINQALGEAAYANAIGKPKSVIIGVETKDIADGGDPETISFNEEGRTYMETELAKVYAAFASDPAFGGIALHHYSSLIDFPSEWGPAGYKWAPPADNEPPSAPAGQLQASAFHYDRIDLSYGMAQDNTFVNDYRIYRSTEPSFNIGPDTYAGTIKGLSYKDKGLLPDTTYYYKVTAVDIQGNEGPPSETASAVTGSSSLKPMVITDMSIEFASGKATVSFRVIDREAGNPIPANVSGRFTHMAGKYVTGTTDENGIFRTVSESVSAATGEIGFLPRRIMASGYYWASGYDELPYQTATWEP